MNPERLACGCASGEEPVHFQTGVSGEAVCAICGWVWVAPGWNEPRVPLFEDREAAALVPEVATPSAAELQEWLRLG